MWESLEIDRYCLVRMEGEGASWRSLLGELGGGGECPPFSLPSSWFWPQSWGWASEWKCGREAVGGLRVQIRARGRG